MKKLLLVLMFVLALYTVSATDCVVKCENQGSFCLPDSDACEYNIQSGCDQSMVNDDDNDGWQDGCDAFTQDSSEWMDIDGDGVGHNKDCDDFDASNTEICIDDNSNSGSGSSHKSSVCFPEWECTEWSDCEDGFIVRTCEKTNNCEYNFSKPLEKRHCSDYVFSQSDIPQTGNVEEQPDTEAEAEEIVPEEDMEDDSEGLGAVSGAVGLFGGSIRPVNLLIVLFIFILLALFVRRMMKN